MPFYSARDFDQEGWRVLHDQSSPAPNRRRSSARAGGSSMPGAKCTSRWWMPRRRRIQRRPAATGDRSAAPIAICRFSAGRPGETDFRSTAAGRSVGASASAGRRPRPRPRSAEGQIGVAVDQPSVAELSVAGGLRRAGRGRRVARAAESLRRSREPHIRKQIDGVKSVASGRSPAACPRPGRSLCARDKETVRWTRRLSRGPAPFSSARCSSSSSPSTSRSIRSRRRWSRPMERGEIMRWPARIGQRHVI